MRKTRDKQFMQIAVGLARQAEDEGNVPVGAIIVLDGQVVGRGKSQLLVPHYHPGRHAEIEALGSVDHILWERAQAMTCYSTLEPCIMCAGALLLHGIGRVVFGAHDRLGGAGQTLRHLPPYYDRGGVYQWDGPILPNVCDPLYQRADVIFADLPVGRSRWEEPDPDTDPRACLDRLATWREHPRKGLRQARKDIETYAQKTRSDAEATALVLPYAKAIFKTTTYLKDYKQLAKMCRRAGDFGPIEDLDDIIKDELPDIWIERAIARGDVSSAITCWYEHDDHRRIRHAAQMVIDAAGDDDPELVISARMSTINYLIGRKKRRHYRRACAVLRKLRDELDKRGSVDYWQYVIEDVRSQWASLPALQNELDAAGFPDPTKN